MGLNEGEGVPDYKFTGKQAREINLGNILNRLEDKKEKGRCVKNRNRLKEAISLGMKLFNKSDKGVVVWEKDTE